MYSKFFHLDLKDFTRGLLLAVMAPVITVLADAINVPGFDFLTFNWQSLIAIAVTSGGSYLLKNLFSDDSGKFLGAV